MRKPEFPVVKDIVLLGGGHAHVSVLRKFGMSPINGARVTLISPEVDTPYSGMLPGLIAGHYTFDEAHIDLGPLARFAGARYFETAIERIDPIAKLVHCTDGRPPVPYDVLSINTGSTPVFGDGLVLDRDVIPVKPVSTFLRHWGDLKARVLASPKSRIGIVGAGAGGVELLLSMQYAIAQEAGLDTGGVATGGTGTGGADTGQSPGDFHVFTRDEGVLKTHGGKVRETMRDALTARGITLHTNFNVSRVSQRHVSDGPRNVAIDEVIWVTGAQPPSWFADSGLNVDERGFVAVDRFLRSTSHPEIFGAGDAVTMMDDPRPKSGVFAVRQGPVLAQNIRARVLGQPLKRYRAQKAFLSLISTGDKFAVASYAGQSIRGEWVWRWKDRIDRTFMRRFNELPRMGDEVQLNVPVVEALPPEVRASLEPDAMRCGGCGAKVGSETIGRVLSRVSGADAVAGSAGIVLGIGDDAAAIDVPKDKLLIQTVDAFPAMIDDPYLFGQIAANHCLGDIHAMGAQPHSALAVVTLPFAANAVREADLIQLLAGAKQVLDVAGCTIIGGHTAEGAELTLGFSLNGFADADRVARGANLASGQALILTKPIGSGVLFAAHGRAQAKGRWVSGAIQNALQSSAAASRILFSHGARAMTDVTGFGLAGHLGQMLQASNVAARLQHATIPLLPGAIDVVGRGIVSSLQRDNLIWQMQVDATADLAAMPEFQLLFDPQTAGGLLAGVPTDQAASAITALHDAGYDDAVVIGETLPPDAGHKLITLS